MKHIVFTNLQQKEDDIYVNNRIIYYSNSLDLKHHTNFDTQKGINISTSFLLKDDKKWYQLRDINLEETKAHDLQEIRRQTEFIKESWRLKVNLPFKNAEFLRIKINDYDKQYLYNNLKQDDKDLVGKIDPPFEFGVDYIIEKICAGELFAILKKK